MYVTFNRYVSQGAGECLTFLAEPTKVGSALSDEGPLQRASAHHTRLAVPLIDLVGLLKTTQAAVGIDIT